MLLLLLACQPAVVIIGFSQVSNPDMTHVWLWCQLWITTLIYVELMCVIVDRLLKGFLEGKGLSFTDIV